MWIGSTVWQAVHSHIEKAKVSLYLGQRNKGLKWYEFYAMSYETWWAEFAQRT